MSKEDLSVPVQMRAFVGETTEAISESDLELINVNTLEPLSEHQVFLFEAIPSNDAIDSYFTRMDPETTLPNYAENLKEGRALMNSHRRHDTLPLGYSYDGFHNLQTNMVLGKYYMQRDLNLGVSTNEVIKGIQGGTLRDVSIGFRPEWYKCSICGKDLDDYAECPHIPGVMYEKDLCIAWIMNGYLAETSLVFDGATPGAMVKKAQEAFSQRKIGPQDVTRLEGVYGVRFVQTGGFVGQVPDLSELKGYLPQGTIITYTTGSSDDTSGRTESWSAVPHKRFPLSQTDTWSFSGADGNAILGDNNDWVRYKSVHGLYDSSNAETKAGYKYPHHKIEEGTIKTFWRGVTAATARATQQGVLDTMKSHLGTHYREFDQTPPWQQNDIDMEVWSENTLRELEELEDPGKGGGGEGMDKDEEREEETPEEEEDGGIGSMSRDELDEAVKAFETESGEEYHAPCDCEEQSRLEGEAAIGRKFLEDLVDATVQARVRAQKDGFDPDKYGTFLTGTGDIEFIRSELASHDAEAAGTLYSGRKTDGDQEEEKPESPKESVGQVKARLEEKADREKDLMK